MGVSVLNKSIARELNSWQYTVYPYLFPSPVMLKGCLRLRLQEGQDFRLEEAAGDVPAVRCGHGGPEKSRACSKVVKCNPVEFGM